MNLVNGQIKALGGIGILTAEDIADFNAAERRVLALMLDGAWHFPAEIEAIAGDENFPAAQGLRRMRELRKIFTVDKAKIGKRLWQYRLTAVKGATAFQYLDPQKPIEWSKS